MLLIAFQSYILFGFESRIRKHLCTRFWYSIICQGTSIRRQWMDLFGLRIKLPPVNTSL